MCARTLPLVTVSLTANSTASKPNRVVNLMTGFKATEEVSLNGSPTVSQMTVASWSARAFLLQLDLDDLLGVVPGRPGVGHEDGLIEAEDGDGNQVADEEEGLDEGKGQRGEEHRDEDVQHALLRVLRADFDHLLAVADGRLLRALQLDVRLDELHGAIGAGAHRLRGGAGEPVDHGAAGDQAQHKGRVQQGELIDVLGDAVGERHDDGEDHGGGAHHRGADQHRLGRGLEGVARAVILFQHVLGAVEIHVEIEVPLDFLLDVRNLLNQRKLVNRLGVVRHRAVGIDRDRHRTHAQKAESHQAKGEHRGGDHEGAESQRAEN